MVDKSVKDFFRLLNPLFFIGRREIIDSLKPVLSKKELGDLKFYWKMGFIGSFKKSVLLSRFSEKLSDLHYYQFLAANDDPVIVRLVDHVNRKVESEVLSGAFKRFARLGPVGLISKMVAPKIVGADVIKESVVAQLFTSDDEPVHVLLLGDPGTGKTDIIRSVCDLSPVSSFGLGSGTTNAGLTLSPVKVKKSERVNSSKSSKVGKSGKSGKGSGRAKSGKSVDDGVAEGVSNDISDGSDDVSNGGVGGGSEFDYLYSLGLSPGLLVLANGGLCCIDELNLLKKNDKAGLYSAMEKGFITYDKKGKHLKIDAKVKVLATANPVGDRFIGKDVKFLKSQIPFKEALLSRFHLVFIFRRPSVRELESITRSIVDKESGGGKGGLFGDGERWFVKEFVKHASLINVSFLDDFEPMVVDFIEGLKRDEDKFLVSVGPRTVISVIRLSKAFARARLSRSVSADDVAAAIALLKRAFYQVSGGSD